MAKRAFDQRIQLQWVVKDTANCSRFTQARKDRNRQVRQLGTCLVLATTDTYKSELDAL